MFGTLKPSFYTKILKMKDMFVFIAERLFSHVNYNKRGQITYVLLIDDRLFYFGLKGN